MEDHDRPQVRFQQTERVIELVTIGVQDGPIRDGDIGEGSELHLAHASATMPGSVEAGVDGQSVQPGIEPVRVAQPGQVPPRSDHRLLDGIARELCVPEDEPSGRVQPREGRADEHGEGVMIAPPRLVHERSLVHGHLRFGAAIWSRSQGMASAMPNPFLALCGSRWWRRPPPSTPWPGFPRVALTSRIRCLGSG